MAYLAAQTFAGSRKRVNEDACCIEVAQTAYGEVLMAIVCDGVGGLSRGDIASSTVIDCFVRWFERRLPALMDAMTSAGRFDFDVIQADWDILLHELNTTIRAFGLHQGAKLGTTFTGIIACEGRYLVGHVGDCRAYRLRAGSLEQLTVDQTMVAQRLAAGEITEQEARRLPSNVISQAVGTQRGLEPAFSAGDVDADDLFVICCDGAYHRIGNDGLERLFAAADFRDEGALDAACQYVIGYDLDHGEKDNLTVVCFSGALEDAWGRLAPVQARPGKPSEDDAPTFVDAGDDFEDSAPTMVGSDDYEDDAPTFVDTGDGFEDDAPTFVDGSDTHEDEAPTFVDAGDDYEDDAPTFVDAGDDYEDEAPTFVDTGGDLEDDAPTMVGSDDFEDDAPTMIEALDIDEDDAPTVVEGADA